MSRVSARCGLDGFVGEHFQLSPSRPSCVERLSRLRAFSIFILSAFRQGRVALLCALFERENRLKRSDGSRDSGDSLLRLDVTWSVDEEASGSEDEPAADEPAVADESAVDEPAATEQPAVDEPAAEEEPAVADEPAADDPAVAQESAVDDPAASERTAAEGPADEPAMEVNAHSSPIAAPMVYGSSS